MERDYADERRQAHEYIRKLKAEEWYERPLADDEYNEELTKFEEEVFLNEGLWMTCNFGYTMEFSTSKLFFEEKAQILERSSQRLKKARWRTMRCSTCEGYNEDTPIHVDIEHAMDWGEQFEERKGWFAMNNILRKKYPKGTASFKVDTLRAILDTIDPQSDLGIELSLAIDESVEIQSHVEHYS